MNNEGLADATAANPLLRPHPGSLLGRSRRCAPGSDDTLLFRHVYAAGEAIADPGRVIQMWSREFIAIRRENACFVLTCHPFISGRASRVALTEDLVRYMRRQSGVWFTTCEEVPRWHEKQRA